MSSTTQPIGSGTVVRVRGRDHRLPAIDLGTAKLVLEGRLLRSARLFDEELVEDKDFPGLDAIRQSIASSRCRADYLCLARPFSAPLNLPDNGLRSEDNLAILSTRSFDEWWTSLPQEARKNARLCDKRGVTVKPVAFDDELVAGIKRIYDETPVRQGRRFWHYGVSLARVKELNETYLSRSQFIGAYHDERLIGFVKYVTVDKVAILIQIIAMEAHRDKRAIYGLIRKAVQSCESQGLEVLTYGKYDYGVHRDSSLSEFKRRCGFEPLFFPRYYLPLTSMGRLACRMGLHLGLAHMLPLSVSTRLHDLRSSLIGLVSSGTRYQVSAQQRADG
jgi:hypothetical protein